MDRLDSRTHLFILILATILFLILSGERQIHSFVLLSAIYMALAGYCKKIIPYIVTYTTLVLFAHLFISITGMMYVILSTFARAIPLMMIASPILYGNPDKLIGTYSKMHIPRNLLIMICILIRFFPVMWKEILTIRDGIRARGIFPSWYSRILHPLLAYECFFVPLTVRCLKLSTELGASAELRGLESSNTRTCIYPIYFSRWDLFAVITFIAGSTAIIVRGA